MRLWRILIKIDSLTVRIYARGSTDEAALRCAVGTAHLSRYGMSQPMANGLNVRAFHRLHILPVSQPDCVLYALLVFTRSLQQSLFLQSFVATVAPCTQPLFKQVAHSFWSLNSYEVWLYNSRTVKYGLSIS